MPQQDQTATQVKHSLKILSMMLIAHVADPVVIELPKGGYTLWFRLREERVPAERKRRWSTPQLLIALTGLAAAIAVLAWWWAQHRGAPVAIAVLPLENVSHDPGNDYFADGLTDELIRNLSIIDGLAVRSRTSSFAFKGKPQNVREAGKQLGADYILEGSVLRAGHQLRINAQLVRVRDDSPIWSGRFDRELTDALAIQEEISRGIVNSLRLKLGRGRRRYETSAEAYELYLRARAGGGPSIGRFNEVIAKDPSFAPAYAGLATASALRSSVFGFDLADEAAKMRAAAEKAIQLDPLLAEAHAALGLLHARDGQWEQSERSFRRAIELDPSDSMSHYRFAFGLLLPLGRIAESLEQLRVAEKSDPLSPEVQWRLAWVLNSAGRSDQAAAHCLKLPEGHPRRSQCLGRARLGQGRTGEAVQVLEASNGPLDREYLGYAYGKAGRREEAEKLAAALAPDAYHEALNLCRSGRQRPHLASSGPYGPARRCADRPRPQLRGILPASWRSTGEGSSQEGRLARLGGSPASFISRNYRRGCRCDRG